VYSQTLRPFSCTPRQTAQPSASKQGDGTTSCRNNCEAYFAKAYFCHKKPHFFGRDRLRGWWCWGRGRCGAAPAFGAGTGTLPSPAISSLQSPATPYPIPINQPSKRPAPSTSTSTQHPAPLLDRLPSAVRKCHQMPHATKRAHATRLGRMSGPWHLAPPGHAGPPRGWAVRRAAVSCQYFPCSFVLPSYQSCLPTGQLAVGGC
jgi:hypothetical protein